MNVSAIRCFTFIALITMIACGGGGGSSTPPPVSTAPTISGISPNHGSPGTPVVITGTNLTGATSVSFNGSPAFSFSVASTTQVDAVVPGNATTGAIQVTTPNGSAASPAFTVDPALAPTIASFAPGIFSTGSVVTLTGTHFVGATQVQFNGLNAASFSVTSDTQIQATAPSGLTAGTISVMTPGGTAVSGAPYTVGTPIQVLMNPGFEQTAPLIWQGDTGIIQNAPGTSDPAVVPRSGTKFAWLAGYGEVASDQITQDLYIPPTAQYATATFYVKILTRETGTAVRDTLTVAAMNTSGTVLGTLLTKSNLDVSDYRAYSVDLLPYKGQAVRLSFKSQEDAQNATSFLLDDVVVNLMVPTPTDLQPLIASFTPASGIAGEVTVQIMGGNFFGLTDVTIGGTSAAYSLTDGTRLSVPLPAAATGSAPIRITNAQGTGVSATPFSVVFGVPAIASVNPTQGSPGTPVVIAGNYLGYPGTALTLNGLAITPTTQSSHQITFTVPVGGTSGSLVVATPGGVASTSFTVTPTGPALDVHVAKVQLTQSTQTLDNTVPIVAGKAGLIRVFVLANQANTTTPSVQVTLLNGGLPVAGYPKTIPAPGGAVPTALDEGSLTASWNLAVPATDLTTPTGSGYSLQATVDPGGSIPEADESNNTATAALNGTTVPIFKTTIFPVVLSSGTGNITEANKEAWAARLAKMFPVASVDVALGAPFTGSVSSLTSEVAGWSTLLNELATKHQADGASDRYYFGAVKVSYSSGTAGLGYVPSSPSNSFRYRTALGWDKASGYADGGLFPEVFAHETGHNMGRNHSPCGNVDGADPNYPYAGGSIGVWGYDSILSQMKSPLTTKDIMGYCTPNWVSDYVYKKILDFRGASGGFIAQGAEDAPLPKTAAPAAECLIVRGIVRGDGTVELLPSFRTRAVPSAIPIQGDYALECLDQKGLPVFHAPLELVELGCGPAAQERHFVAALPLEAAVLDAVAGLNVLRSGLVKASLRSVSPAARSFVAAPDIQRLDGDRVQLTWDASVHPAALVRDADSGEVIAILSGGRQVLTSKARRYEVALSDGVTGHTIRIESLN